MMEEVVKILGVTFLNSFLDNLDKNQLYNIVSGKTVSTEIKDRLITIDEKEPEMMLEYIQRTNKDNVTDSMMMDINKKKVKKKLLHLTFQLKYRRKEKQEKLKCKETYWEN